MALSRDAARALMRDPAFRSLWEPGGPCYEEAASITRLLTDDADRSLSELDRLRGRLKGIEFVRLAVERAAADEQKTPVRRAARPAFVSRFLPRPVGG